MLGITEDDDIKSVKDILKELKDAPRDKPLSLELFKKFGDLKICEPTDDRVKYVIDESIANREIKNKILDVKIQRWNDDLDSVLVRDYTSINNL